jgi:hypothetical protein
MFRSGRHRTPRSRDVRLLVGNVDSDRSLLVMCDGKLGKTRPVPHGPRISAACRERLELRKS